MSELRVAKERVNGRLTAALFLLPFTRRLLVTLFVPSSLGSSLRSSSRRYGG